MITRLRAEIDIEYLFMKHKGPPPTLHRDYSQTMAENFGVNIPDIPDMAEKLAVFYFTEQFEPTSKIDIDIDADRWHTVHQVLRNLNDIGTYHNEDD